MERNQKDLKDQKTGSAGTKNEPMRDTNSTRKDIPTNRGNAAGGKEVKEEKGSSGKSLDPYKR